MWVNQQTLLNLAFSCDMSHTSPAQEVPLSGPVYHFGDFRLDCGAFQLLRNGHSLRVERKPMELLILLASREGQLVTRSEIARAALGERSLRRYRTRHQYRYP